MNAAARAGRIEVGLRRCAVLRVEPRAIRAARAKAAIIRPFQAVSTLSSRCGRGRRDPCTKHLEPRATQDLWTSCRDLPDLSQLVHRPGDIQQVLAGELLLRIRGRVAVRLDAEPRLHDAPRPRRAACRSRVRATGRRRPRILWASGSPACSGGTLSASSAE